MTRLQAWRFGDLPGWRLEHAGAELDILAQGAQILRYQRAGEPPLLWCSPQASYQAGQSVRGGVPVCWPWFGDLGRNPPDVQAMVEGSAPFHGLARSRDWQLLDSACDERGVSLSLQLSGPLPGWAHTASLSLHLQLDDALTLRLHNHNHGVQPLAISQALHSYFAVSDIQQVQVSGLHDCHYLETLDDWQLRQQQGALRFSGETDRIYLGLPDCLYLDDPLWQRRLCLESQGSRSAILWNPWQDKAQRLSQFPAEAWQQMLCIETANVWDDCLHLAPGAQHSLQLRLSSQALPAR
ncbi:D-hexose-6-phosphate mutarotase [Pseudomonas fluvialis]|uniref:D-hexose-6-phosphate mutarotase n=1 Tax=Pseudomonas fluvialis TaxID=1793966 RepID=UPI00370BFCB1